MERDKLLELIVDRNNFFNGFVINGMVMGYNFPLIQWISRDGC
jgi:hypothetical protein